MANVKRISSTKPKTKIRPALTPEAREQQAIAMAMDLAIEQLQDGSASSQVITHFLKLGTAKNEAEVERLRYENNLIQAKIKAMQSTERIEELYENAISAMRDYSGRGDSND